MGRPIRELPEQTQADLRLLEFRNAPEELGCYLAKLADAGWGYQPAATVLGVHRQTVRQWAREAPGVVLTRLPEVPVPPPLRKPVRPPQPQLTAEEAAQLRGLNVLAQQLRPEHTEKDPRRVASEDLSEFINQLTQRGITYQQIADVLGVKKMTVRARLKRHGYRTREPSFRRPYRGRQSNTTTTKESA